MADAGTVTACEVAAEIKSAMRCLRHMPTDGPREPGCAWVDVYHSPSEAYGWLPAVVNKIPPSTTAISRMDQVLFHWLPRLTDDERILVTARGAGLSWRKIMRIRRKLHSRSHAGHKLAWRKTIAKITSWLHPADSVILAYHKGKEESAPQNLIGVLDSPFITKC